jgi:hypothetical protein
MLKVLFITTIVSLSSFASDEFMEFGERGYFAKNKNESKMLFELGANYFDYPSGLPQFDGKHENYSEGQSVGIYGLALALGWEQHLAGNFSSTIKLGGFYNETVDKTKGNAGDGIDLDLASIQSKHQLYGVEASISLNYLIDNSVLPVQPFVAIGLGQGHSTMDEEYDFKGVTGSVDPENYDVSVEDTFTSTKITLGVNFISASGITSYIKASSTSVLVSERESNIDISINSVDDSRNTNGSDKENVNETNSTITYAMGLGILF